MRMRLTWRGEYGRGRSTKNTFKVILGLVIGYIILVTVLSCLEVAMTPNSVYNVQHVIPLSVRRILRTYVPVLRVVSFIFFALWALYSLCMTRETIRVRYSIRQSPHYCGCEDLCCAMCCTCCTVAQMARHTGEYETYPGVCCSETGLPRGAPTAV